MKKTILIGLMLLFCTVVYGTVISDCQEISTQGYYELSADLKNETNCINITTSNVTLDGKGFSILGNNTVGSYGIVNDGPQVNITIENFDWIGNWTRSISFTQVNHSVINNNTFFTRNTTQNNKRVINFDGGSFNNITNNLINHTKNIYNYQYGIYFENYEVQGNQILNNKIYLRGLEGEGYGIAIDGNNPYSIKGTQIRNNYIEWDTPGAGNYPIGFYIDCGGDCSNVIIDNNTIINSTWGMFLFNRNTAGNIENWTVTNNYVKMDETNDPYGIWFDVDSSNTATVNFENNTVIIQGGADAWGHVFEYFVDTTIKNSFINVTGCGTGGCEVWCFDFTNSQNITIQDSTCDAHSESNWTIDNFGSVVYLLNVTTNGFYDIASGTVTRQWYYSAFAQYYGGGPLNATIEILRGSTPIINISSDLNGYTNQTILSAYIVNSSGIYDYVNHTIRGHYLGEIINKSWNISYYQNILNDTFNFSRIDPIHIINITPITNGTYPEGTNTTYNVTVTHDEGRDSVVSWFVDGIRYLIETVSNGMTSVFVRTWKYIDEDYGNPHNVTVYINDSNGDIIRYDWTANITNVTPLQAFEQSPDYLSFDSQVISLYCFVNDSQDNITMSYRMPGSSDWINTTNASFDSVSGSWISNVTTEPTFDWVGTLDFRCTMYDATLGVTAYQYDYDTVEVYATQVPPNTPNQLTPLRGTFNSVINLNCHGTDPNGDVLTYDIQANFTNTSSEVTGWEYLSQNDSNGRTEWFILNLPPQNMTKIRCRSNDGTNFSEWYEPTQDITIIHPYALQMFTLYPGDMLIDTNLVFNVYCSTNNLTNSDIYQTWSDCNSDGQWDYVWTHWNKTNMTGRVSTVTNYFTCTYSTADTHRINVGCVTKKYNTSLEWDREICSVMKETDTYCNYRKSYEVIIDDRP